MKTLQGSFLLALTCTAIALADAMLKIGGILGFVIGCLPLGGWLLLVPFYLNENTNDQN